MPTIRPDFGLLQFNTYAEYLKSFITLDDRRYLANSTSIQEYVKLGYRSTSRIYEKDDFKKIRDKTLKLINPRVEIGNMWGGLVTGDDPGLLALAKREQPNLLQKLSTIVFLVVRSPSGFDISGYIDYTSSLQHFNLKQHGSTNWKGVFQGTVKLRPKASHLSYNDPRNGIFAYNNSENYETMHVGQSLVFMHKGDHKMINLTDLNPGASRRTMIHSPAIGTVILYDHIVRRPI